MDSIKGTLGLVFLFLTGCLAAKVTVPLGQGDAGAEPPEFGDASAAGSAVLYRPTIHQILVDEGCLNCHGGTSTTLTLVRAPTSDGDWERNHRAVVALTTDGSEPLLLAKAYGAGGHNAFLTRGDEPSRRILAWISAGAPLAATESDPPATPPMGDVDAGAGTVDAGATVPPPTGGAVTWAAAIEPLIFDNGCTNCHGDRGGYSLASLSDAMGPGSDETPNIIPGDVSSKLLTYARRGHQGMAYADALLVMAWIIEWDARAE